MTGPLTGALAIVLLAVGLWFVRKRGATSKRAGLRRPGDDVPGEPIPTEAP